MTIPAFILMELTYFWPLLLIGFLGTGLEVRDLLKNGKKVYRVVR